MLIRIYVPCLVQDIKTIKAFIIALQQNWLSKIIYIILDQDRATQECSNIRGTELQVFIDAFIRNDKVRCSLVVVTKGGAQVKAALIVSSSKTINIYIAELRAIIEVAEQAARLPSIVLGEGCRIIIYSNNMSVLQAISNPRHQSGQRLIKQTIIAIKMAFTNGRCIQLAQVLSHIGVPRNKAADRLAARHIKEDSIVRMPSWAKGTFRSVAIRKLKLAWEVSSLQGRWKSGRQLRELDSTLLGKHVRLLYNNLIRLEAQVLAQLRTGHSKLQEFLFGIGVVDSNQYKYRQGKEDTWHFVLYC